MDSNYILIMLCAMVILSRGLVTILLYYQIPEDYRLPQFNEGILFFVIIATNLLMMLGLMVGHKPVPEGDGERLAF